MGMPRRGLNESSARQWTRRRAGGNRATVEAEILRQQDETWRRMGEREQELRTAVGAVKLRAHQRMMLCSNTDLNNSF